MRTASKAFMAADADVLWRECACIVASMTWKMPVCVKYRTKSLKYRR